MDKDSLKAEIAVLEEKTQNLNVDLAVLAEYRRRAEEHSARSSDLHSAVTARDTAKKRCDDLRKLRLEGFMTGFSLISLRLKEMYQMITMGGNAELELVDSLDPFSEGILFSVMPPKKSWKNISNLSGGEKTLSSLALVFALHHYKPTPLYVMDEIDAALDFRNVSLVLFVLLMLPVPHILRALFSSEACTSTFLLVIVCYCTNSTTYDHRHQRTGHPVRSAIHKLVIGRLVVGSVTTSESLLLYVFAFLHISIFPSFYNLQRNFYLYMFPAYTIITFFTLCHGCGRFIMSPN